MKRLMALSTLESSRGIVTSIVSNGLSQLLIYLTSKTKIKNKDLILYLITFLFANVLSYSLDILLAKDKFNGVEVPLTDLTTRSKYLFEKFFSFQIVRFFVLVCIDVIVVSAIFRKTRKFLDHKNIKFKNRDQLLMIVITFLTFIVYGNTLRFSWVYVDKENTMFDALMFSWLTILFVTALED